MNHPLSIIKYAELKKVDRICLFNSVGSGQLIMDNGQLMMFFFTLFRKTNNLIKQ